MPLECVTPLGKSGRGASSGRVSVDRTRRIKALRFAVVRKSAFTFVIAAPSAAGGGDCRLCPVAS